MFVVQSSTTGALDSVVLRDEASASSVTVIPARGALVTSFFAGGRQWLYLDEATLQDESQNVRGGIPVLFPSPGKLSGDGFARGDKSGSMKQHGFARNSRFEEIGRGEEGSAWVELSLDDSAATRAQFPFGFRLRLRFALALATLTIRAAVRNTGDEPLPFALGYHPYFVVAESEKAAARVPTRATRAWDNKNRREIDLGAIDLTAQEVDLHLLDHGARHATLQLPAGKVELSGDFSRWVVWTLPSKDFVCLEPWTAPANALNSGEGLLTIEPGQERTVDLSIVVG